MPRFLEHFLPDNLSKTCKTKMFRNAPAKIFWGKSEQTSKIKIFSKQFPIEIFQSLGSIVDPKGVVEFKFRSFQLLYFRRAHGVKVNLFSNAPTHPI